MYLTVGTLDDRVLAQTGLAELPLDPSALLAGAADRARWSTRTSTRSGSPRGRSPRSRAAARPRCAGRATGEPCSASPCSPGLDHHYPNGNEISAGFRAAPEFWAFFRRTRCRRPLRAAAGRVYGVVVDRVNVSVLL